MHEIVKLDALALSSAIKSKRVSCVETMSAYLDHIDLVNPIVNEIVSLQNCDDLLKQAKNRDEQLARGEYLGWMHGFPQAIKDLEPTKGIRTTLGSPLFILVRIAVVADSTDYQITLIMVQVYE